MHIAPKGPWQGEIVKFCQEWRWQCDGYRPSPQNRLNGKAIRPVRLKSFEMFDTARAMRRPRSVVVIRFGGQPSGGRIMKMMTREQLFAAPRLASWTKARFDRGMEAVIAARARATDVSRLWFDNYDIPFHRRGHQSALLRCRSTRAQAACQPASSCSDGINRNGFTMCISHTTAAHCRLTAVHPPGKTFSAASRLHRRRRSADPAPEASRHLNLRASALRHPASEILKRRISQSLGHLARPIRFGSDKPLGLHSLCNQAGIAHSSPPVWMPLRPASARRRLRVCPRSCPLLARSWYGNPTILLISLTPVSAPPRNHNP